MSLFGRPDIQELYTKGNLPGLYRALTYQKKDDYQVSTIHTNAARAIGQIGNLQSIDKLIPALKDSDNGVVTDVTIAIGQITLRCVRQPLFEAFQRQNQEQIKVLLQNLSDIQIKAITPLIDTFDRFTSPEALVEALGLIAGTQATGFLLQCLDDKREQVRVTAIKALPNTGDPRLNEALVKALADFSDQVKLAAVEILERMNAKPAVGYLLTMLWNGSSELHGVVVNAIIKMGDPADIIPLLSCSQPIRKMAADALAAKGDLKWQQWFQGDQDDFIRFIGSDEPNKLDLIAQALSYRYDNSTRIEAAQAAGKLDGSWAVEHLIELLLDDSSETIRQNVAGVLGQLSAKDLNQSNQSLLLDSLVITLGDPKEKVRLAAVEALNSLGENRWQKCIQGNDEDFQRIGSSGEPQAVSILTRAFDQGVVAAGRALAVIDDPRVIEPLIKALSKSDFRETALDALARFKDQRMIPALVDIVKDKYIIPLPLLRKAAQILVDLYQSNLIDDQSKKSILACRSIIEGHQDSQYHRDYTPETSNDCSICTYDHTDKGINVKFPTH